jgi:hypothetical protein
MSCFISEDFLLDDTGPEIASSAFCIVFPSTDCILKVVRGLWKRLRNTERPEIRRRRRQKKERRGSDIN